MKDAKNNFTNKNKGFTLVEIIVSVGIFSVLAFSVIQVYFLIINGIIEYRDKAIVASLANQYIEIARNLPYADIGTVNGTTCDKPEGEVCFLPGDAAPAIVEINGVVYSIYYSISYVDDPADGLVVEGTDSSPNDYKQIKLYVTNTNTNVTKTFLTVAAPKSFESLGNRGVLAIKVFNATGQPISGAAIHIVNENVDPAIDVTRISDANGDWLEIGVPPDVNGYHITTTKAGYSTDQTYPITEDNPNPAKPYATILVGEVTQASFSIDYLSRLTFSTLNQTCQVIPGVDFEIRGSKLIGTAPIIYKFDKTYTSNSNGLIYPASDPCVDAKCLEWDSYQVSAVSGSYMIYGTSPIQQSSVLPGTVQEYLLMLGPVSNNSLLVVVKNSGTGDAIEGAEVNLEGPSSGSKITGGSVWGQSDWSGGFGQEDFVDASKYFEDDGGVDANGVPSGLRLAESGGVYVSSGILVSSTFDTGTEATTYTILNWQPISQTSNTEVRFQIATSNTNNEETIWNFVGPDGTNGSYYSMPGNTISSANNNKRYARYKVFLSTTDSGVTPLLSSVSLNYISGCHTPGQVMFNSLTENTSGGYQVTVTKEGYTEQIIENLSISGYNLLDVSMDLE